MPACFLPIHDILIDYCNQELKETPPLNICLPSLPLGNERSLSRYVDPRYIRGKLRRMQWVDRKVEWAKIVAAIHKDCIIPSPGTHQ